ncbi:MAG TPA: hypothetical protein EYM39_03775, partial [Candidatus Latescibacteria bacterium]|nr:hypothetical protein [Candidatus Latescibacterota bacterium]
DAVLLIGEHGDYPWNERGRHMYPRRYFFEQAITHPCVKFEVVFGVSDSDWPLYDLDHGRRAIGYYPQDRSHVPLQERT